ncbi:MAG: flagellar motor protein MotB [Desulfobacterales bacterium]|nr:flagellar motor protein MotB [Desulfobacterales bacterium]
MARFQDDDLPKVNKGGAPMWVVTFGDMMSLLLCFFVLLLSISEMDRQKYKQAVGSLGKAFAVKMEGPPMDTPKGMEIIARDFDQEIVETRLSQDLGKEIDQMVASDLVEYKDQIAMETTDAQVTVRLMGESTFDSGKDEIREKLKPLLANMARVLEKENSDIIIAGHTDNRPMHSGPFKSNLRLSIARAAAVADFLLTNSTIDPKRISTMGFGEFRPIESNSTERGREKNRRVEIILSNLPGMGHQER